jgi:hypothetical protein
VCLYVLGMKETLLRASNVLRSEYVELIRCIDVRSSVMQYSRTPLIRKLVIRIADYPNRLGRAGKSVQNSIKLTCLEITGYQIKYSAVL